MKEDKTNREKLRTAGRILMRRIRKKYRYYRRHGQKYYFLPCVALTLLFIFMAARAIYTLTGPFQEQKIPEETEAVSETETETEKIYPEKEITIGSTGCMLLHSPFIDSYPDNEGNYDFSSVYKFIMPYYSAPDYMTCEFEGALGGEEMGYSGYPSFRSPDIIIENIRDSGVDLQFLATNHIYDGWSDGFRRTKKIYKEKNIPCTGIRESEQEKHYYIADVQGVKIGFVNYTYGTTVNGVTLNGMPMEQKDWNLINVFDYNNLAPFYREMADNIRDMKQEGAQFLIAQMHWGNEYQLTEADYQQEIAKELANMGIDAIIGGHPHCEQPIDVISSPVTGKSMFCIYSEGNALSNQRTYLMDEMPTGHTEDGAMITLTLHQDRHGTVTISGIDLLPTWVYRWRESDGSKYYILPLDDVADIESVTGISGIREEAEASYNRTMDELLPGLEKARESFGIKIDKPIGSAQIGLGV